MARPRQGIPDNVFNMLADADKKNGFPAGTMLSVMQQEIGGQTAKFLGDPTAYHYEANAQGKRIAGHTGKISTAFGPFGILESTGRDPGYGVKPLQSKDLGEQVRFAADYLAARSKSSGSLNGGLAGYGEGAKYAQQVTARLGNGRRSQPSAVVNTAPAAQVVAALPAQEVQQAQPIQSVQPQEVVAQATRQATPIAIPTEEPVRAAAGNEWDAFIQAGRTPAKEVTPEDLNFAEAKKNQTMPQMVLPDFMASLRGMGAQQVPVKQTQANLMPARNQAETFKLLQQLGAYAG